MRKSAVAAPLLLASLVASLLACSSTSESVPSDSGARSAACVAQDRALQSLVDTERPAKVKNAYLAVRNPGCGMSTYISGSSETATTSSLWRIASVTKTFTAASILSLVKEGKVSLDDPVSKWVPNLPSNTAGVTVTMLLDHRSGLFDYTYDTFDWYAHRDELWTPRRLVDIAMSHTPYFAPDADFRYSNTNYILLGMILEAATGQPAGAVLHARTIDPAKLSSTFFDGYDTVDPSRRARGFGELGTDVTFSETSPSAVWTTGAMVSSGTDVADWVATLYGTDEILDASQRALLTSRTSAIPESWIAFAGVRYGLGVFLLDPSLTGSAGPGLGHGGVLPGYITAAYYFPDKKTSVVWIQNGAVSWDDNKAGIEALGRAIEVVKTLFP